MPGVRIVGIGHYSPDNCISNDYLASIVDTSDEWIVKRTGIKTRNLSQGEGSSELGAKAALNALKNSGCSPEEIDLIIVATTTPDSFTPSSACRIQGMLGCINAAAFDISAACSGFLYSLIIANNFLKQGERKKALLIGTEVLSRIVDWSDRNTCILFGDGAGTAVVEFSEEGNGIMETCFGSDGSLGDQSLRAGRFKVVNPICKVDDSVENNYISMDGKAIFKFAVSIIPKIVEELLEKSNLDISDIKYIVPHQANMRIIKDSARRLHVEMDKFFINLDKYGNTSAASIPIALSEMSDQGLLQRGDKIIVAGFGGGLTWGGALIEW